MILYETYVGQIFPDGFQDDEILAQLADSSFSIDLEGIRNTQARHLLSKILVVNAALRPTCHDILKSAFFQSGLDTRQYDQQFGGFANLTQTVNKVLENTETLLAGMDALRRQILECTEVNVPRLFIVIPESPTTAWKKLTTIGKGSYRLHLLCEDDECPHLSDHPGYLIEDPTPFFRKAGPIISFTCKLLGQIASTVAGVGKIPVSVITYLDSMATRPTEYFTTISKVLDELNEGTSTVQEFKRVQGPGLRELEAFLNSNDPAHTFGNLYKTVNNNGEVRYLCRNHYHPE